MPEFRKDIVTREWVILAKERSKKPSDFERIPKKEAPAHDSICPFCPGNESMTPPEVLVYRKQGGIPNSPGWQVRVTPNKFPALLPEGDIHRRVYSTIFDLMDGVGVHEVVIENPYHDKSIDQLPIELVEEVLWSYRERYETLMKDDRIKYIIIFRNHGRIAGSSLTHPHSQIVALPVIPQRVWGKVHGVFQYYEYRENCVYCDMLTKEREAKERIISENSFFVALCPYASRSPFQIMIVPKIHNQTFIECKRHEIKALAHILKEILIRLREVLSDPPYNYTLINAPIERTDNSFHWHIDIFPRLSTPAGFEIGTGMYINTVLPEDAARYLKEIEVPIP